MSERATRIALVTEQIDIGGKRSHVDALAAGLEAIGIEVRVFDAAQLSKLERAWIALPHHALESIRPGLGYRWMVPAVEAVYSRRLRAAARRWRPDLWHAQEPITYRAVRAASAGRPVALTVHGPVHREVASARAMALDAPAILQLRELESRAYRESDAVISVDRAHAEYVKGLGREGRVWVIPNFVDTRRYHPGVVPAALTPDVEKWIGDRPLLLCPRRLVPKNGVDVAVRAVRSLAQQSIAVTLCIAGDGPQRGALESLCRELGVEGSVRFLGDVDATTMPGLCRRASVVLVPSVPSAGVEEATSIAVLEGQACERPVIASELGGLREIIEHERSGLLFPPGDALALAGAIARVLADPVLAESLGRHGWESVRDHHSHEAGARAYAAVYAALGVGISQ